MLIKVFEATVLVIIALVFTNVIFKELNESCKIRRLFNSVLVMAYIITIVVVLICSFVAPTKESTKQENEIVIELKED